MKFVKGISFFVIYPLIFIGAGFIAGVECTHFFYPGKEIAAQETEVENVDWEAYVEAEILAMKEAAELEEFKLDETELEDNKSGDNELVDNELESIEFDIAEARSDEPDVEAIEVEEEGTMALVEVSSSNETLSVDTEYVLEETDITNHTVVETTAKLPMKYVGMDRTQFLAAMESYEAYPPLSEKERGFVGLEVLSFSRDRVVIQMNYEYQQPGEGFYLAIKDHEVVVYKEDLETVYINTGILVETLPDDVQLQLIQMIWIAEEQELYDFLENYSS